MFWDSVLLVQILEMKLKFVHLVKWPASLWMHDQDQNILKNIVYCVIVTVKGFLFVSICKEYLWHWLKLLHKLWNEVTTEEQSWTDSVLLHEYCLEMGEESTGQTWSQKKPIHCLFLNYKKTILSKLQTSNSAVQWSSIKVHQPLWQFFSGLSILS